MKPFNLEEYLKDPSQKVVTRDGRDVRIVCTDFLNSQPIIGLVAAKDEEGVYFYYKDGRCFTHNETNLDLFFAPTKREGWVNIYQDPNEYPKTGNIYESKEEAITKKDNINYKATIKIEWEE